MTSLVYLMTEDVNCNEPPRVLSIFSSLELCAAAIKPHIESIYDSIKDAKTELDGFRAVPYVIDGDEKPSDVLFDLHGRQEGQKRFEDDSSDMSEDDTDDDDASQ